VFWDPLLDESIVQAVNTRQVAGWQLNRVLDSSGSPGSEWLRVATVVWTGAAFGTITDTRTFLFEGPANSSPQTFRPTWGGGSDRNAARETYGVKTLERFASAVLKKVEEIQSSTASVRWWDATVESLDRKVSRFGDSTMAGNYLPDVTGRDLGSSGFKWDLFVRNLTQSGGTVAFSSLASFQAADFADVVTFSEIGSDLNPDTDAVYDLGQFDARWNQIWGIQAFLSETSSISSSTPNAADALLQLRNYSNSTPRRVVLALLVGGTNQAAADGDGWTQWVKRTAAGVTEMHWSTLTAGVFSLDAFRMRRAGGIFYFEPVGSSTSSLGDDTASNIWHNAAIDVLRANEVVPAVTAGLGGGNLGTSANSWDTAYSKIATVNYLSPREQTTNPTLLGFSGTGHPVTQNNLLVCAGSCNGSAGAGAQFFGWNVDELASVRNGVGDYTVELDTGVLTGGSAFGVTCHHSSVANTTYTGYIQIVDANTFNVYLRSTTGSTTAAADVDFSFWIGGAPQTYASELS